MSSNSDSTSMGFERLGDGSESVVFVHGISSNRDVLRPAAELVAQNGLRAILVDLPGHSAQSPSLAGEHTIDAYSEALASNVDRFGLDGEKVTLVGHSMGSLITARFAKDNPDMVSRSIVLAPAALGGPVSDRERDAKKAARANWHFTRDGRKQQYQRVYSGNGKVSPAQLFVQLPKFLGGMGYSKAVAQGVLNVSYDVGRQSFDSTIYHEGFISDIVAFAATGETTIVRGTKDSWQPEGMMDQLQRLADDYSNVEIIEYEGEGHDFPYSSPEKVANTVCNIGR